MLTKRFKRLLSVFLCMTFLVSQFYCEQVSASDNAVLITYEQVNQKIVDAYENGVDPTEIFEGLSDAEVQILSSYYADVPAASVFSEEVLENDEIEYIDALAAQYYNALESNGQIEALAGMSADEMDELFDSVELPETLNVSRAASYYEPADYSAVIKTLGYSYTLEQIARQLVALGSTINLGAAFPFIELAAIVAGAFIVTLSIAVLYCAAAVAANELVCGWYLYNTSQVKEASRVTAAVVAQHQSGTKYWRAIRADWGGMGGILIADAITINTAARIVGMDTGAVDVFSMTLNDAEMLVEYVGNTFENFSGIASVVQVHYRDDHPLNMQHIHAMTGKQEQGKTHIFFAMPYFM